MRPLPWRARSSRDWWELETTGDAAVARTARTVRRCMVEKGKKGKKKEKLTWAIMSSHGLLLRLFLSPAYFSLHVALKYLLVYADNIGITYYLTRRLREAEVDELNDAWGFIW